MSTNFNDPDFDAPVVSATSPSGNSFFDRLDPKSALTTGLAVGVMTVCTIGFIVLLFYMF